MGRLKRIWKSFAAHYIKNGSKCCTDCQGKQNCSEMCWCTFALGNEFVNYGSMKTNSISSYVLMRSLRLMLYDVVVIVIVINLVKEINCKSKSYGASI